MGGTQQRCRSTHARTSTTTASHTLTSLPTPYPFLSQVDYVVITSVDRDDIPDGGAEHYARVVRRVKELKPSMRLECLTPDFNGTSGLAGVATVATAGLDVYAHNIETVARLQSTVRDRRAGYRESIGVLEHARLVNPQVVTKTSIMLGLGEEAHEIRQTMRDMYNAGVEIFTLGQYLRPSKRHMKVARMLTPEEYEEWRVEGEAIGFKYVASGPLVRSSYKAGEVFMEAFLDERERAREGAVRLPSEGKEMPRSVVWTPPADLPEGRGSGGSASSSSGSSSSAAATAGCGPFTGV